MIQEILYDIRDQYEQEHVLEVNSYWQAVNWYQNKFIDQCIDDGEHGCVLTEEVTVISFIYNRFDEKQTIMEKEEIVEYDSRDFECNY